MDSYGPTPMQSARAVGQFVTRFIEPCLAPARVFAGLERPGQESGLVGSVCLFYSVAMIQDRS